jgi:hypothetical protein
MPKIFISYRREDTPYEAVPIRDRLAERFGKSQVFFDVDTIPFGHDFSVEIDRRVGACDYFIALIGKKWLAVTDENGKRRLDDPNDWVRLEIEAALRRKIPVIPLLFHNVRMPKSDQLPLALAELSKRQAHSIRPLADFTPDIERLLREIDVQEKQRSEAGKQAEEQRQQEEVARVRQAPIEHERREIAQKPQVEMRSTPEYRERFQQDADQRIRDGGGRLRGGKDKKSAQERETAQGTTSEESGRVLRDSGRDLRKPVRTIKQEEAGPLSQLHTVKRSRWATVLRYPAVLGTVAAGLAVVAMVLAISFLRRPNDAGLDGQPGSRVYEARLNQYLTPQAWVGENVQLRLPNQFQLLSGKTQINEKGEEHDPRQPAFAEIELPGLQGAWQTRLSLTGGQGQLPGWLYVCSNYHLLAKRSDEARARSFNAEVVQRLASGVGRADTTPPIRSLPLLTVPPKAWDGFAENRKFRVLSPGIAVNIGGKPYRIRLYCYKKDKSPAQITLVYVVPDPFIVEGAALDYAIDVSLETLVVTQDGPSPSTFSKEGKGSYKDAGGI